MPQVQTDKEVAYTVTEPREIPALSLFLGFGAMAPLLAGVAIAALVPRVSRQARTFVVLWGSSVLLFLAGVRRGLSFRTPGGPDAAQIAVSMWYFVAGGGSLALFALRGGAGSLRPSLLLLLLGYTSVIPLDASAARRLEAPPFFGRLRPAQMLLPIVGLSVLLALSPRRRA